ncbi:MAG: ABC transporter substrate-binding protein [Pseudomonadota bacterium]
MNFTVHLSIPPNVARRTRQEIAQRFPEALVDAPDTHPEMLAFARACGPAAPPDLAVSAYPHLAVNLARHAGQGVFATPSADLPPLRPELAGLGMQPPVTELRIITVAPVVLAANNALAPGLADWADLCAGGLGGGFGCPPLDTPLPYLVRHHLEGLCRRSGAGALPEIDTASPPLEINKRVDAGDLAAGVLIPAFGRAFRLGGGRLVWPRSGALAVPLMACLAADAPPAAHEMLAYLLSLEFQTYLAQSGALAPTHPDAPGFPELDQAQWRLLWPGWQALAEVASDMDAALPTA